MIYCGIDYSLTSPSVCEYNTDRGDFCFENCSFLVLSDKKTTPVFKNIKILPHKDWTDPNERYHNIASSFMEILGASDVILIEDYSFGSKGKVFHIAENTEVLMYNLWLKKKKYNKIPPTALKKWATGKGNAQKDLMYLEWRKDPKNPDLGPICGSGKKTTKIDSPISDIIDSYWLTKYAFQNYK